MHWCKYHYGAASSAVYHYNVVGCMHLVVLLLFAVSFDNYMQHDAHEFLNYLLNTIADLLQGNSCFC